MERTAQHHLIRTVISLCELAATATDHRIRDDLTDEAAIALDIASLDQSQDGALQKWAGNLTALFVRLERVDAVDQEALAYANVRLLRLQASLPTEVKTAEVASDGKKPRANDISRPKPRALGQNQQRVFEWLRENPGKRTHELIAHFAGKLSGRTIKRALKDLVVAQQIRRTEHEGAVAYEPIT